MNSRVMLYLCGLGIALFAVPAHAIYATKCYCSTNYQWSAKAQSLGWGTHYLYNFDQGEIRKYKCLDDDTEPQWMGGTERTSGESVKGYCGAVGQFPVEGMHQNHFADLVTLHNALGDLSKIGAELYMEPSAVTNAGAPVGSYDVYDLVNIAAARNQVGDFLDENLRDILDGQNGPMQTVAELLLGVLQTADLVLTSGEILKLKITITFTDGSKVDYIISAENNNTPTLVEATMRDASDNPIVQDNSPQYRGTYWFSGDPSDIPGWIENMQNLGIPVTGGGGGDSYRCIWDSVALSLTCHID